MAFLVVNCKLLYDKQICRNRNKLVGSLIRFEMWVSQDENKRKLVAICIAPPNSVNSYLLEKFEYWPNRITAHCRSKCDPQKWLKTM